MRDEAKRRILSIAAVISVLLAPLLFVLQVGLIGTARAEAVNAFHNGNGHSLRCEATTDEVVWMGPTRYQVKVSENGTSCGFRETITLQWVVFGWVVVGRSDLTHINLPSLELS